MTEGEVCAKKGCCGKRCPFATEAGAKAFVEKHSQAVENIQAMLMFRRPVPMAILLIIVELMIAFIGKADLGFLPVLTMFITFYLSGKIIVPKFQKAILEQLFPELIDKGAANAPNRIRSNEEVAGLIWTVASKVKEYKAKKIEYTPVNIAILLGISTLCFIISNILTTLGVFAIVIHVVLLAPGILLHPAVYPKIAAPLHLKQD